MTLEETSNTVQDVATSCRCRLGLKTTQLISSSSPRLYRIRYFWDGDGCRDSGTLRAALSRGWKSESLSAPCFFVTGSCGLLVLSLNENPKLYYPPLIISIFLFRLDKITPIYPSLRGWMLKKLQIWT